MILARFWCNIKLMKKSSRIFFFAVSVVALLVSGCKKTYFDLELHPDGDTLQRTYSSEFEEEEISRLTGIYGHEPETEVIELPDGKTSLKYSFVGEFQHVTPKDIGGSGFILHCDSAMGSSSMYSEQFRGNDDLADVLGRQEIAFNRVFDIILLWLETEFDEAPDLPALLKVIDEDVRQDLWNLSLTMSTLSIVGTASDRGDENVDDRILDQITNRAIHFLIARGYFEAAQLPVISFSFADSDETQMFELLARTLMNKMGLPPGDPLLPTLAALHDNFDEYDDSLDLFLESDERLVKLISAWESESRTPQAEADQESDYIDDLLTDAFASDFHILADDGEFLRVDLHIPKAPYSSNGVWDGSGELQWRERLASGDARTISLPNTLFALWSEPNDTYQEEHFGRVVLDDENLGDYCLWRRGLSKKRGREWDKFVKSLEPGEELIQALNDFQFKGEADWAAVGTGDSKIRSRIAYDVVSDLIKALNEAPDEERQASPVY